MFHRPNRPGIIDADARRFLHEASRHAHAAILEPEAAGLARGGGAVQPAIDGERLGHAAGANRVFDAANQNRRGPVFRADHEVEHFVDAVTEIHIPHAAGAVEHIGAGGATGTRVARLVALAVVGLRLDDHAGLDAAIGQSPDEVLSEQPPGQRNRFLRLEQFWLNEGRHPVCYLGQMDWFVASLAAMTDSKGALTGPCRVFCFGLAIASAVGQRAGARQTARASARTYTCGAKTKDPAGP